MGFKVDKDVMVPMRDGVSLATDVWIPDGGPVAKPVLLVRNPYGKDNLTGGAGVYGQAATPSVFTLLDHGYVVVWQDCRGAHRSEGDFTPVVNEPADAADTLAWLREQPWCDGAVGTFGASYLGFTQWAAASQAPEGLTAIAPTMTTTDYYTGFWYSQGGATSWHSFWMWSTLMAAADVRRAVAAGHGDPQAMMALVGSMGDPAAFLATAAGSQELLRKHLTWYPEWVAHPDRDEFWQKLSVVDRVDAVRTPALNVAGWFDIFVDSAARTFARMKAEGGSAEARAGQRLVIGPWDHLDYSGVYPDRQFGMAAGMEAVDVTGMHLQFYDRWLRGRTDALDGVAPVRIFVMGIDEWRDEQDWPLPDTTYVDYYLDGGGRAGTAAGDGVLTTEPPSADATDRYTYDPADPVPSLGGRLMMPSVLNATGPVDQTRVEERPDVLCFSTPVLDEPVEVTGHVSLVLHVASSARDTDFTGKLVDVFPDGRAIYLTDGILRARYRSSLAEPELLEAGHVYEITLDLAVTSNVFLPGHRIRLEVSSSNFPRYDRNTNTGGVIAEESLDQAVVAVNDVLHGPSHPSRLVLPVIRR